MVYCGKPSGGCHSCRQKKSRCDQVPEGCGQCKRARRECPGYRVRTEVVFRHESQNVIKKFKAKQARNKAIASSSATVSSNSTIDTRNNSCDALELVPISPMQLLTTGPRLEECAMLFFASNYVVGDQSFAPGRFDYLSGLYRSDSLSPAVVSSIKAVGFAGYAHLVNSPSILRNAQYEYGKAIRLTNAALGSPHDVKKDTTLMAVMILSIFETVMGTDQRSLGAWTEHVYGASMLLKLRGRKQLKTEVGRRFFYQVVNNLAISCLQRGQRLPDYILHWSAEVKKLESISDPMFFTFHGAIIAVTNFRADILHKVCSDPQAILARALELDNVYISLAKNAPTTWSYDKIYSQTDTEAVYNGYYHMYHDYHGAQIWNSIRVVRIILHEQIRNTLLAGFATRPPLFNRLEDTNQFQQSTNILYQMQADILASVPQHLGILPPPGTIPVPALDASNENDQEPSKLPWANFKDSGEESFPVLRSAGPNFLIWPLWFVGVMGTASKEVKEYTIRSLRTIGNTMGIRQANFLADSLVSKIPVFDVENRSSSGRLNDHDTNF